MDASQTDLVFSWKAVMYSRKVFEKAHTHTCNKNEAHQFLMMCFWTPWKISASQFNQLLNSGAAVGETPEVTQQQQKNAHHRQNAKPGCRDKNPVHDLDL